MDEWLERVEPGEREELAFAADGVARGRADARTTTTRCSRSCGPIRRWPPWSPARRARPAPGRRCCRGCARGRASRCASSPARVTAAFGLAGEEARAEAYLERMERGELDATRVSRRLLDALGEALGVSGSALAEAGDLRPARRPGDPLPRRPGRRRPDARRASTRCRAPRWPRPRRRWTSWTGCSSAAPRARPEPRSAAARRGSAAPDAPARARRPRPTDASPSSAAARAEPAGSRGITRSRRGRRRTAARRTTRPALPRAPPAAARRAWSAAGSRAGRARRAWRSRSGRRSRRRSRGQARRTTTISCTPARGASSSAANAFACTSRGSRVSPASTPGESTGIRPPWPSRRWPSSWASVNRWRTSACAPFTHSSARAPVAPAAAGDLVRQRGHRHRHAGVRLRHLEHVDRRRPGPARARRGASRARLAPTLVSSPGTAQPGTSASGPISATDR